MIRLKMTPIGKEINVAEKRRAVDFNTNNSSSSKDSNDVDY